MKARIGTRLLSTLKPTDARYDVYDEDLPGFLLRVEPSGIQTYYIKYRNVAGERQMFRIGPASTLTVAQARSIAKEHLADVTKGKDPRETRQKARCDTLRDFLDGKYGEWLLANRKAGAYMLARLKTGCADLLDKKLADINPWAIEKWRKPYIERKAKVNCNRHLAYLKSCLAHAVEWGVISESKIADVKRLKVDADRQGQIRTLTAEEEVKLWAAVDAREERIRQERDNHNKWCRIRGYEEWPDLRKTAYADFAKPLLTVALYTGARRGELFSLEWQDVNWDRAVLTIRAEVAKSGKTRRIPLNAVALECLKNLRAQSTGEELLFPSPQGGGKLTDIKKLWASLMKDASIQGLRLHDLRHTFATRCLQAGADVKTVSELLGHSDISITSRYLHSDDTVKAAAVARIVTPDNTITFTKVATGSE